MIPWGWVLVAFMIGGFLGMLVMGVLAAGRDIQK